jgi:hypothetical protein
MVYFFYWLPQDRVYFASLARRCLIFLGHLGRGNHFVENMHNAVLGWNLEDELGGRNLPPTACTFDASATAVESKALFLTR